MRGSEIPTEVRIEQARAVLAGLRTTLAAATVIMISLACVLWPDERSGWVLAWLAASLLVTFHRWRGYRRFRAVPIDAGNVETALRRFRSDALIGGLVWGVVPLMRIGEVETASSAFTVFILAGTSAGALIQSLAYAPVGMLFFLPVLLSAAVSMFACGTLGGIIVGFDLLLLAFMMTRQGMRSTDTFRSDQELRLDALRLARSLAEANRETVAANVRLNHLATHDALTALHNRAALAAEMEAKIAAAREAGTAVALAIVDLDNFKLINDTQGHAAGDRLLVEVAGRLVALCRSAAFVARLGGDEFAVLAVDPDARDTVLALADGVIEAMDMPVAIDGRPSVVGASVGVALFPGHATDATGLLACADIALYEAKRNGRRRVALFDASLKRGLDERRRIEGDVAEAIARERLELHFQPQVDLLTGRIVGHEGLIRWTHPELGSISPPVVVAAARAAHVGDRLTAFAVDRACRLLGDLERLGDATGTVAINVSPVEFRSSSPADTVLAAVARHGVDPRRLEIEITEEAILDFAVAAADLSRLAAAGVRLAIDDFGAGHFSLANLTTLRFDRLKIDRGFVAGIDVDERNRLVVGKILALARELGIVALAEGVETEAEAETLRLLGCGEAQGWLFGRPETAERVLERMRSARVETRSTAALRASSF